VSEQEESRTEVSAHEASKTRRTRSWILAVIGLLVAAVLVVVIVVALTSGHSRSYQDGYRAGQQAAKSNGFSGPNGQASAKCQAYGALGALQASDNTSDWIQGCVAGYIATNNTARTGG
jgi:hypothetical protein